MAGLALITVGIVVHSKLTVYLAFFGTQTNPLAILLLAMGAIVFVIGFFGCCGAYKRNYCLAIAVRPCALTNSTTITLHISLIRPTCIRV